MQSRFEAKKRKILEQLSTPDEDYEDLSPKGSIDEPIRTLIRDINRLDGLVTTSSCSGRISVFLEGRKKDLDGVEPQLEPQLGPEASRAGPGGKGGGGAWLFVSHSPVEISEKAQPSRFMPIFGLTESNDEGRSTSGISSRYIHLKFEPMILHILTSSLDDSQRVLTAALSAGFRESGAVSLNIPKTGELNPMVAVRSTGYSFDSIVGVHNEGGDNLAIVDEKYLRLLVDVANDRFKINTERIARFRSALLEQYSDPTNASALKSDWEDPNVRRQRKREEGLARQRALATNLASAET